MTGRVLVGTVLAVAALAALSGCSPEPPESDPSSAVVRFAAPAGSGSSCTESDPCALADAIAGSTGGEVRLLAGEYGDVDLRATGGVAVARTDVVVVVPADGAQAVLGKVSLDLPATEWRDLVVSGGVYLDDGATGTVLDGVHVDGSGVFVHASGVRIRDAVIENGDSIDGLQIAGATDLVVEGTTIRGFRQDAASDVHADCVQIFDSSGVVLRGNTLADCDNAALIFSPGQGEGIAEVLVEANHIQGCVGGREGCSGGTALDLRAVTGMRDVVVRNNTILDGAVRVDPIPGLVFDRNIVGYASNCDLPMTNSIVAAWNTGLCDRLDAIGRDGNREGEVPVVDRAAGDLRPVDPRDAAIEPVGGEPAESGHDGEPIPADQAGAGG